MTTPASTRTALSDPKGRPDVRQGTDNGATYAVASFAAQAAARRAGSSRTDAVLTSLVDTLTVAGAGGGTPAVGALLGLLECEPAPGECSIWGSDLRVGPSAAALVNGTAAHALDWDDASPTMPMHPGAVLV